jgi:hypothetical protein
MIPWIIHGFLPPETVDPLVAKSPWIRRQMRYTHW